MPSSSDGFYVDNTAPVFDQDIMGGEFYYDVGQGNSTPAEFQNSNNTIKCIWKCDDEESGIVVRTAFSVCFISGNIGRCADSSKCNCDGTLFMIIINVFIMK